MSSTVLRQPPSEPWRPEALETLERCPVCESPDRALLHDDLTDLTFGAAPGRWSMWRCESCGSGYLDPRPDEASIGEAYKSYYTHEAEARPGLKASLLGPLIRDAINRRYGFKLPATLPLSWLWLRLRPAIPSAVGIYIRHLSPPARADASLLDIGCGSGEFLALASELGFRARGLDPDPKAARVGSERGLDVAVGGLPKTGEPDLTYDHVTLSHVLEHLHDPVASLCEVRRVLKPGGRVWITQPNIGSRGLQIFGRFWRGLEPPRHLVLASVEGLSDLLRRLGFTDIVHHDPVSNARSYFGRSLAMQNGLDQNDTSAWTPEWSRRAAAADAAARRLPSSSESMTISAVRQD